MTKTETTFNKMCSSRATVKAQELWGLNSKHAVYCKTREARCLVMRWEFETHALTIMGQGRTWVDAFAAAGHVVR